MKTSTLAALSILLIAPAPSRAQDPLKVAPHAYQLRFENDWVRVVEVNYGPREKIVAHDHTPTSTAYVYLNDAGPVDFVHIGLSYGAVTRPATVAGSFRLYRGLPEVHEVKNDSDTKSRFLRVEFKTEPKNDRLLRGKFFREEYPKGENFRKVQFENDQIRVTRLVTAPGLPLEVFASPTEPALLVALTDVEFGGGGLTLALGSTEWIGPGQAKTWSHRGRAPAEMLRFDFRTRKLTTQELEELKGGHAHPKGH